MDMCCSFSCPLKGTLGGDQVLRGAKMLDPILVSLYSEFGVWELIVLTQRVPDGGVYRIAKWWGVSYRLSGPGFNCMFSAGPEEDGLPGPGLLRSLKCQLVALKQLHAWAWFFVAPSAFVKGSGYKRGV